MIIVGELINASRKAIASAIEEQDLETIKNLAKGQFQAGANFIDVNAGVFVDKESEYLKWLVTAVQSEVETPCCIDSPDPKAIEAALAVHKGTAMINSISLEKERYESMLSLLSGTNVNVVALCMSDEGMPQTTDQRLNIADKLINGLVNAGFELDNIYVDPLVQPVATDSSFGVEFLASVEQIMARWPGVHTMCGLSNISYGLPERKILNQTFMAMAIAKGLDGAIFDPLDRGLMAKIIAAETLAGRDDFCGNYLQAYRDKKLNF